MKILFISRWFPYPADNGSRLRILNVLRQLAVAHDVRLLSFADAAQVGESGVQVGPLGEICSSVRAVPYRAFEPWRGRAIAALLAPKPRLLADTYSSEMAGAVREELRHHRPDIVIASQLDMVPYAAEVPDVPVVLEELELSTLRDAAGASDSLAARLRAKLTWLKMVAYLGRTLPRFSACTVVSERERENVRAVAPGLTNIAVVPNAVDIAQYRDVGPPPRPNSLVFSGALTYLANYDAVLHFLHDVYPSVRRAVPEARLQVTGSTSGVNLGPLSGVQGVEFTGYVADIRPTIASSWASVVPLRIGGGTRLKILEALALGTPVISSTKGAEGLDVRHGEHLLLADNAEEFASHTIELLQSPSMREHLAARGKALVAARYDWSAVGAQLRQVVESVA